MEDDESDFEYALHCLGDDFVVSLKEGETLIGAIPFSPEDIQTMRALLDAADNYKVSTKETVH